MSASSRSEPVILVLVGREHEIQQNSHEASVSGQMKVVASSLPGKSSNNSLGIRSSWTIFPLNSWLGISRKV